MPWMRYNCQALISLPLTVGLQVSPTSHSQLFCLTVVSSCLRRLMILPPGSLSTCSFLFSHRDKYIAIGTACFSPYAFVQPQIPDPLHSSAIAPRHSSGFSITSLASGGCRCKGGKDSVALRTSSTRQESRDGCGSQFNHI
jgi:hypothetical protein